MQIHAVNELANGAIQLIHRGEGNARRFKLASRGSLPPILSRLSTLKSQRVALEAFGGSVGGLRANLVRDAVGELLFVPLGYSEKH